MHSIKERQPLKVRWICISPLSSLLSLVITHTVADPALCDGMAEREGPAQRGSKGEHASSSGGKRRTLSLWRKGERHGGGGEGSKERRRVLVDKLDGDNEDGDARAGTCSFRRLAWVFEGNLYS